MAFVVRDRVANGQQPAPQQLDPSLQGGELTLGQVCAWANGQARRLAEGHGLTEEDGDLFLLAQTVKLGEEVGELHAEVLGRTKFQRAAKAGRYDDASLAGELADVTICIAILSELLGANLSEAVMAKIAQLEARARR
jgi:NTP pyrophosphatase (non-canonical NTP hydrolase)